MLFVNSLEKWIKRDWTREDVWMGLCAVLFIAIVWNVISACLNPMIVIEPTASQFDEKLLGQPYQMHANIWLNAPYFGVYASVSREEVLPSTLDVKVVGILFSHHPASSQVLLRNEAGFDKLYRIGDAVKDGVLIESIHPDGVVISNHGKLERINLPQNTLKFDSPPAPLNLNE